MLLIYPIVLITGIKISQGTEIISLPKTNAPQNLLVQFNSSKSHSEKSEIFDKYRQPNVSDEMSTEVPESDACTCWNVESDEDELECRCHGYQLTEIPRKLPNLVEKLVVQEAALTTIRKDDFQEYKETLRELTLISLPHLSTVEGGAFRNVPLLRSLYISHAPHLESLSALFSGITSKKFLSLRIMHTGLEEVPNLAYLDGEILHMVDLEDNKLHRLESHSVHVKAEQVLLSYNLIEMVDAFAFNGSQIAKLSLKGNRKLTFLHKHAFSGLKSLLELDLSGTSIQNLPVSGLGEIEVLRIQDTRSLKVIPSLYNFKNLKEAWLTHSFHCCAFKYPAQHDPTRHAMHEAYIKEFCQQYANLNRNHSISKRSDSKVPVIRKIDGDLNGEHIWNKNMDALNYSDIVIRSKGEILENISNSDIEDEVEDFGFFHQTSFDMPEDVTIHALCGNLSESSRNIVCFPKPDALNPCEDIMGFIWLRISVWFVVITAVIGNVAVVIVFFSSLFDVTVPKFLMCHLAFADLCMGFYLLLIASMDLHSMGFYFNFAFDWQIGYGCQMAGFLTVFSSQLSVFTLTVITLERWFAIRYAIYLNRRIHLSAAAKIMIFGWFYSILLASLPLVGISNYSSTSICLPMEARDMADKAYLITLLLTNGLAFCIIVICYTQIYFSLGKDTRRGTSNSDMTIAKKMALLIFTDFACWAPIAFFGLTAIAGYPLINVTKSKILLVFFYPLNSCANPYLYAILTSQYRKDFFTLLYRCGICKKRVRKFTASTSLQTTNQSHPLPLLPKANGRKISKSNVFIDEAIV